MYPAKRTFLASPITSTRIAALTVLCALVAGYAAPRTVVHKKAAKPKASAAVPAAKPVQARPTRSAAKRDTSVVATDTGTRGKRPDSTAPAAASPRRDDSVFAKLSPTQDTARAAVTVLDTLGEYPSAKNDMGKASVPEQTVGKVSATAKSGKRGLLSISVPLRGARFPYRSPPVLLAVAAAAFAATVAVVLSVRNRRDKRRFLTTTRLSVMDKEVQRACRYVEQHYADPGLTPQSICEVLVTGESFLEVLMERNLGMRLSDFITHVRINGAKKLLEKNPAVSKESAAVASGFSNVGEFDEAFGKATGVSFDSYHRPDEAGA
jgi:AraC-like DNA-binding protein